jgi:hypothetical protein
MGIIREVQGHAMNLVIGYPRAGVLKGVFNPRTRKCTREVFELCNLLIVILVSIRAQNSVLRGTGVSLIYERYPYNILSYQANYISSRGVSEFDTVDIIDIIVVSSIGGIGNFLELVLKSNEDPSWRAAG